MKFLIAVLFTILVASCSVQIGGEENFSSSCDSSYLLGSWRGRIAGYTDTISFNSNCSGYSSYCGSSFTFSPSNFTSGTVSLNITNTTKRQGCLPPGRTTCAYVARINTIQLDCGLEVIYYVKD